MLISNHWTPPSTSSKLKSGRSWVCRRSARNFARRMPKGLLNVRQSNERVVNMKMKAGIARLKSEMMEIKEEQKYIAKGHKQMRKKYEEIQKEREQLWNETKLISKQSLDIRARLNLMFQILKARVDRDSTKVAQLTRSLRDLISKPRGQKDVLMNPNGNN